MASWKTRKGCETENILMIFIESQLTFLVSIAEILHNGKLNTMIIHTQVNSATTLKRRIGGYLHQLNRWRNNNARDLQSILITQQNYLLSERLRDDREQELSSSIHNVIALFRSHLFITLWPIISHYLLKRKTPILPWIILSKTIQPCPHLGMLAIDVPLGIVEW